VSNMMESKGYKLCDGIATLTCGLSCEALRDVLVSRLHTVMAVHCSQLLMDSLLPVMTSIRNHHYHTLNSCLELSLSDYVLVVVIVSMHKSVHDAVLLYSKPLQSFIEIVEALVGRKTAR
jgi:hypothetical protein